MSCLLGAFEGNIAEESKSYPILERLIILVFHKIPTPGPDSRCTADIKSTHGGVRRQMGEHIAGRTTYKNEQNPKYVFIHSSHERSKE